MLTVKEREDLYAIFDSNYEENEKFFNKIKEKEYLKEKYIFFSKVIIITTIGTIIINLF